MERIDSRRMAAPPTTAGLPPERWGSWDYAQLWVGLSVSFSAVLMANTIYDQLGAVASPTTRTVLYGAVLVAGVAVLWVLHWLNGEPGTRYRIGFPTLTRAVFDPATTRNVTFSRAGIAFCWLVIQTSIGAWALTSAAWFLLLVAGLRPEEGVLYIGQFRLGDLLLFMLSYLVVAGLNASIMVWGVRAIRGLMNLGFWIVAFLLLVMLFVAWQSPTPTVAHPVQVDSWTALLWTVVGFTSVVGYWITTSLNIADFSCYARRQRDQRWGQLVGLTLGMALVFVVAAFAIPTLHAGVNAVMLAESSNDLLASPSEWVILFLSQLFQGSTTPAVPQWIVLAGCALVLVASVTTNIGANYVPAVSFLTEAARRADERCKSGRPTWFAGWIRRLHDEETRNPLSTAATVTIAVLAVPLCVVGFMEAHQYLLFLTGLSWILAPMSLILLIEHRLARGGHLRPVRFTAEQRPSQDPRQGRAKISQICTMVPMGIILITTAGAVVYGPTPGSTALVSVVSVATTLLAAVIYAVLRRNQQAQTDRRLLQSALEGVLSARSDVETLEALPRGVPLLLGDLPLARCYLLSRAEEAGASHDWRVIASNADESIEDLLADGIGGCLNQLAAGDPIEGPGPSVYGRAQGQRLAQRRARRTAAFSEWDELTKALDDAPPEHLAAASAPRPSEEALRILAKTCGLVDRDPTRMQAWLSFRRKAPTFGASVLLLLRAGDHALVLLTRGTDPSTTDITLIQKLLDRALLLHAAHQHITSEAARPDLEALMSNTVILLERMTAEGRRLIPAELRAHLYRALPERFWKWPGVEPHHATSLLADLVFRHVAAAHPQPLRVTRSEDGSSQLCYDPDWTALLELGAASTTGSKPRGEATPLTRFAARWARAMGLAPGQMRDITDATLEAGIPPTTGLVLARRIDLQATVAGRFSGSCLLVAVQNARGLTDDLLQRIADAAGFERDQDGRSLLVFLSAAKLDTDAPPYEKGERPDPFPVLLDRDTAIDLTNCPDPIVAFSYQVAIRYGLARLTPYRAGGPVGRAMFFGRETLLTRLAKALTEPHGSVVLVGISGVGKTSASRVFAQRAIEQGLFDRVRTVDLQEDTRRLRADAQGALTWMLLGGNKAPVGASGRPPTLAALADQLETNGERLERQLWIIDEADYLWTVGAAPEEAVTALRALCQHRGLHVLMIGKYRLLEALAEPGSGLKNFARLEQIGGLAEGPSRDLIEKPMRSLGFVLPEETVDRIVAYSFGWPKVIQATCGDLLHRAEEDRAVDSQGCRAHDLIRRHRDVWLSVAVREIANASPLAALVATRLLPGTAPSYQELLDLLDDLPCLPGGRAMDRAHTVLQLFGAIEDRPGVFEPRPTVFEPLRDRAASEARWREPDLVARLKVAKERTP